MTIAIFDHLSGPNGQLEIGDPTVAYIGKLALALIATGLVG